MTILFQPTELRPSTHNVAITILEQLGGQRFRAMTGANGFLYGSDNNERPCLQFYFKGCRHANHLTIHYERGMDEYTMTFMKIGNGYHDAKQVSSHSGVYCDQLQDIFTRVTGLDTHL